MGQIKTFDGQRLFLDTNAIIYAAEIKYKEADPILKPAIAAVRALFAAFAENRLVLVTSELTLSEVLTEALISDKPRLADYYRKSLSDTGVIEMVAVDREIWEQVANLRAKFGPGLKTPDAIQIAAAIKSKCDALVGNDRKVAEIATETGEITGVYLSDL